MLRTILLQNLSSNYCLTVQFAHLGNVGVRLVKIFISTLQNIAQRAAKKAMGLTKKRAYPFKFSKSSCKVTA